MILAFPAWRRGYFKVTGPVIDAALRRVHTVVLLAGNDPKPGEGIDPRESARRWPDVLHAYPPYSHVRHGVFDAVIGPQLESLTLPKAKLRISLDHMWEQANAPVRRDLVQCFTSPYQRYLAGGEGPVIGSTTMDAFGLIDKNQVRARYGFGSKPVFLLFSPKLRVPHLWRRTVYRYLWFRLLAWDLRRWCDREGHTFVVKTRAKHGDPRFLGKLADRVIGDEDLWPHTSAQLVSVASLVVHFQSGAGLEAACAAVPQYSVRLPQPHLRDFRTTKEVYSGHSFTIGRWPKVIRLLDTVERMEPFTVDSVERSRYVERYLGPSDDFKSAERVIELIEARG